MIRTMIIAAALLAAKACSFAWAHSGYSAYCCNNKDCQSIPENAVRMVSGGYRVDYIDQHGERVRGFVKYEDALPSFDAQFHGCHVPKMRGIRCLLVPMSV
jgi:hypothetical protein